MTDSIIYFCKNPSGNVFRNLTDDIQEFFNYVSEFCLKKDIGDTDIAKKVVRYYRYKNLLNNILNDETCLEKKLLYGINDDELVHRSKTHICQNVWMLNYKINNMKTIVKTINDRHYFDIEVQNHLLVQSKYDFVVELIDYFWCEEQNLGYLIIKFIKYDYDHWMRNDIGGYDALVKIRKIHKDGIYLPDIRPGNMRFDKDDGVVFIDFEFLETDMYIKILNHPKQWHMLNNILSIIAVEIDVDEDFNIDKNTYSIEYLDVFLNKFDKILEQYDGNILKFTKQLQNLVLYTFKNNWPAYYTM